MKIYKYEIKITDEQFIKIPNLREVLDVQTQGDGINERLVLWAMVDECMSFYIGVNLYVVATGQEFNDITPPKTYLRTFQSEGFVGHVYFDYEFE